MTAIVQALHGMAATAWVGGIFFAYMALRPAANSALDASQRPVLWQAAYRYFFPLVWMLIGILLITGYTDLFTRFGGFSNGALYLKLMHGIGLLMIVLFGYLYFVLYRRLSKAVESDDTQMAAATMVKMRPVMLINLTLGMIITAVGIAGPSL